MVARWLTLGVLPVVLGAVGCIDEPADPVPGASADPSLLARPPEGEGFQIETEEIVVPPGVEQQDCYFFKVRDLAALEFVASHSNIALLGPAVIAGLILM